MPMRCRLICHPRLALWVVDEGHLRSLPGGLLPVTSALLVITPAAVGTTTIVLDAIAPTLRLPMSQVTVCGLLSYTHPRTGLHDSISSSQPCSAWTPLRMEYSCSRLMWAADNPSRALACALLLAPLFQRLVARRFLVSAGFHGLTL